MDNMPSVDPFVIKNCALAAVATGEHAGSLIELRDRMATTHIGCVYFHFWGRRLHPQFTHPEYNNDFGAWAHRSLHDQILAERLSVIDPMEFKDLEELRLYVYDVLDKRIEELEVLPWIKKEDRFSFIRSIITVFDTPISMNSPEELLQIVPALSPGSVFYHMIDARRRTPDGLDDFSTWLKIWQEEHEELIKAIQQIDPYFLTISELKNELNKTVQEYFSSRKKGEVNV